MTKSKCTARVQKIQTTRRFSRAGFSTLALPPNPVGCCESSQSAPGLSQRTCTPWPFVLCGTNSSFYTHASLFPSLSSLPSFCAFWFKGSCVEKWKFSVFQSRPQACLFFARAVATSKNHTFGRADNILPKGQSHLLLPVFRLEFRISSFSDDCGRLANSRIPRSSIVNMAGAAAFMGATPTQGRLQNLNRKKVCAACSDVSVLHASAALALERTMPGRFSHPPGCSMESTGTLVTNRPVLLACSPCAELGRQRGRVPVPRLDQGRRAAQGPRAQERRVLAHRHRHLPEVHPSR